jgi:diguanylate cyclase (GGDEF)-like protein
MDVLMPMHLRLDRDGRIAHCGPSLSRLAGDRPVVGRSVTDVFAFRRPACVQAPPALSQAAGRPLHLAFRGTPETQLKGVFMPFDAAAPVVCEAPAGAGPCTIGVSAASKNVSGVTLADVAGATGEDAVEQTRDAGDVSLSVAPGGIPARAGILNLALHLTEYRRLAHYALTGTDFAPTDMSMEMLYLIEANAAAMAETRNLVARLQGDKTAAEEQAVTDTLTGLRNRRALDRCLAALIDEGQRFALTNVDLDFFKQVNDTHGHAAGDAVLRSVAAALLDEVRGTDTVARVGGDEFVIVFRGLVDPMQLNRIAHRIITRLERPIIHDGVACRISASMGTALSTAYGRGDLALMLRDADAALYASKAAGRARHTIHDVDTGTPMATDRRLS